MQIKLLWSIIILCLYSGITYGQKSPESYQRGLLYKELFNTAVNTQINHYNALLIEKGKPPVDAKPIRKDHIWYYRGLCYYYQGNFLSAIADFKRIPKSSDKYPEAQIRWGACYYKQGKITEAKKLWNDACSQKKNNPLFLSKMGNLYAELGTNTTTATKYCQKTEKGTSGLVWIYLKNGDVDKALDLIKKISNKPDLEDYIGRCTGGSVTLQFYDPGLLWIRSQVYLMSAVKYYQQAIDSQKNDELSCQLGITQLMAGRLNDSITTLKPLINSNRWEVKAKALINLGVAYYLKGSKQEAETTWNQVENNYKDNPAVMSELGYTYARLGIKLDDALSLCKEGKESYYLGMVYFKRGVIGNNSNDINEACNEMGHFERDSNNLLHLLGLCNAYYVNRDFNAATEIFYKYLQRYSGTNRIYESLRYINEARKDITWFGNLKIEWKDLWYYQK
ncbi:MAG: tetratricopeptide repeat protein [bacterium]